MYDKYKINMKTIAIFIIIALTAMTSSKKLNTDTEQASELSVVDKDFFKQELQNSIMEFCEDTGTDPDSVYMPFRDEL